MDPLEPDRINQLLHALDGRLALARTRVELNAGPGDLLEWGLPEGFVGRLTRRDIGSALVLHLASRLDQIHFKLYAFVDQGLGRHEEDLRALEPTAAELEAAARWTITQDPSEGYRQELLGALRYLGMEDVALDG